MESEAGKRADREAQEARSIAIAFAALIQAYGKPVVITQAMVDALPETFRVTREKLKNGDRSYSLASGQHQERR